MSLIEFTQEQLDKYPQLSRLRVYGTVEEPLFPVQSVAKLIGKVQVRVDQGQYEEGLDYVKMNVASRDNKMHEQNLLTETGLYNVIFRSNTEAGRRFRVFVTSLLKDMRLSQRISQAQLLENMTGKIEGGACPDDHLYFITDGEWTKIGRSNNVEHRCAQLQTGNARELTVLRTFPTLGHRERETHDRVGKVARRRGEWFHISDLDPIYAWLSE